ncbi:hypothetical protein PybrP1_003624 [[Pythium] brassicae (nom. inval.)]|nr:hypothetical protein PybrP1_003624 [[Pythium] brassicae (nom. inval.)]
MGNMCSKRPAVKSPVQTPYGNGGYNNNNNNNGNNGNGYRTDPTPRPPTRTPAPLVPAANTDNCFPELLAFRLDETEVLLTRKVSSGAFGVVWLGHYHGQPVAVKRMIDGEDESLARAGGGQPDMAIVIKVAKGELRPSFAPDCPEIILKISRACLQFDPALRPSSDTVAKMLQDARAELQA